jgi:hypothetical protein
MYSGYLKLIKNHLPDAHAYADDTQLYTDLIEAVTALPILKIWMTVDKLKLNDDKTEFLMIGTRAQLEKIKITKLRIGQVMVSSVSNARNRESWFDNGN